MKPPYYTGRRIDGHPRLFYVNDEGERDITFLLQRAGITFATRIDWYGTGAELAELAQSILWHATRSHEYTFRWGWLLAWDTMGFLEDGWQIPASTVEEWLADRVPNASPRPPKGNDTAR